MDAPRVSRLLEDDKQAVIDTLVLAFSGDPVERWMYPEAQQYLAHFPAFVAAFGGGAFAQETAWGLDDCSAVALWFPPGSEPDGDASSACSSARSHRTDVRTRLRSWARWMKPIRDSRTGTCRGSASTQPCKGRGSAAGCWSTASRSSTT